MKYILTLCLLAVCSSAWGEDCDKWCNTAAYSKMCVQCLEANRITITDMTIYARCCQYEGEENCGECVKDCPPVDCSGRLGDCQINKETGCSENVPHQDYLTLSWAEGRKINWDIGAIEYGSVTTTPENSKRSFYLAKCEEYLSLAENGDCQCAGEGACHCPYQKQRKAEYAQIATAYCTRALLDK